MLPKTDISSGRYLAGQSHGVRTTLQFISIGIQDAVSVPPASGVWCLSAAFAMEKFFSLLVRGSWKESKRTCSNLGKLARVPVSQADGAAF